MASYSTSEFKNGLKIIMDGYPCSIVDNEIVKPGKGQAFNRVKIKNLITGRVVEYTFKSGETLQAADVLETNMQFLYTDGEVWHFMDLSTYEQVEANKTTVGDTAQWIKEEDECQVMLWNGRPISVIAPNFVVLKVTETDPGLKGDTAQGGSKPATLQTGAIVRVPLFVNQGDLLKVDTRTGEYVSRAK